MNWMIVGAIALAAIAVLGIGSAVLGTTGTTLSVTPGVAIGAVGHEASFNPPYTPCVPGTIGCGGP